MGICWSEPPVQQTTVIRTYQNCRQCGGWIKQGNLDYCELCLQKNAANVISPSAPPMYPTQQQYQQQYPQYTYAVQQQTYYPQPMTYISPPYNQYPPQQQRQISTGTAVAGGFLAGMLVDSMLDPTE